MGRAALLRRRAGWPRSSTALPSEKWYDQRGLITPKHFVMKKNRVMRETIFACAAMSFLCGAVTLQAGAPVVSNVRAAQRAGTQLVDIYYDLASASNALTVSVGVSTNSGAAFNAPAASLSGDLGSGKTPGTGKHVVWNAGTDLTALYFPNVKVRVTADDSGAPSGMALIPAGSFTMGDNLDGDSYALPLHTVYVSAFYMDKYDVTKALWDDVYNWAITHGYSFEYGAQGKASNHPAQSMTWYDAVKWCNARSEKEGKTPAYYTDAGLSVRYRSGQVAAYVNWSSGYRLPTEAEWEKAARGGASGQRFPWGNTISWSQANYYAYPAYPLSVGGYAYDVNPTSGYHPTFATGSYPYTSPVDYFAPNGYGLYDMAGNVWQWCWDWSGSYSSASQTDPRGPASGSYRVIRGGCWVSNAFFCRSADRDGYYPTHRGYDLGFRSVLPPGQ
jgi:formylglycine-generating enzyme required for sulfatase activity